MHGIDWLIIGSATLAVFSLYSSRHLKGVADFLAANRMGGRHLLTIAGGIAQCGAILVVADFEMRYNKAFRVCAGIISWVSGIANFAIFSIAEAARKSQRLRRPVTPKEVSRVCFARRHV